MLDTRAALILKGCNYGPNPIMLRTLIRREFSTWRLIINSDQGQPTHGDLNYTNIIFPLDDSTPVVLDFEDTMISWFEPAVDVSMALERFVLSAPVDSETAFQLGKALLDAYRKTRRSDATVFTYSLADYLRILSMRSLLTLAEMESRGKDMECSEWRKFFSLYVSALRNVSLLNRLQM